MCSVCLRLAALTAAALSLFACEREQRRFVETPSASEALNSVTLSSLQPGTSTPPRSPANPYLGNAFAASEGKRLFEWFNCVGCHAHGGGGMGPPLMDDQWIYGGEPGQIFATIIEGRPNGMPSFRGRVPTQQVWQLVTYVQSLSGQLPKDVATGRSDHMMVKPSEQSTPPGTPQLSAPQPQASPAPQ